MALRRRPHLQPRDFLREFLGKLEGGAIDQIDTRLRYRKCASGHCVTVIGLLCHVVCHDDDGRKGYNS